MLLMRDSQHRILLAVALLIAIAAGALFLLGNPSTDAEPGDDAKANLTPAQAHFIAATEAKVVAEMGQPIEGFEPSMFVMVYGNVQYDDFMGAETVGDTQEFGVMTSADAALTERGLTTFLTNVARRANLPTETEADIDAVIAFMESSPENVEDVNATGDAATPVTIEVSGEYTCLPKKDTGGPVTLECAFGLAGDDGFYYGLSMEAMSSGEAEFQTGQRLTVIGSLVPLEAISVSTWHTYDIRGIIAVNSAVAE